ncbi:MAG TPA: hypothetical protein PKO15_02455 [Fibrobacteria bacterium]|nr:hypothetical protein [Fibrobacteria bacterium]HOX50112.1 hypothetical protein [Fibrobacteria bacterium]
MKLATIVLAISAFAQAGKLVKFPSTAPGVSSDSAAEFQIHPKDRIVLGESRANASKLAIGDTVQVDTTAYMISRGTKRMVIAKLKQDSILLALSERQNSLQTRFAMLGDSLDRKWQRIHATDTMAFFRLHSYYRRSDSLLDESIKLNRHLIRQSYLASGMVGAIGGGLVGASFDGSQPTTTILYSIGGAAVGVVANRFFLRGNP